MKFDKFGVGSLALGIILLMVIMHYGFMPAGTWSIQGIIDAALVAFIGGLILFALLLIIIGLMLLLL